jgi:cell wall-associated NlpC family hydrolase
MDEAERLERKRVVEVAKTWLGTPYHEVQMRKGAGVDCGLLFVGVFREAGLLDPAFDPRPYSPQWHMHQAREMYLGFVQKFTHEITEADILPGDVVVFKWGRCFAHGGIIIGWPRIIHALSGVQVSECDVTRFSHLVKRERRFFSPWPRRVEV